MHLCSASICSIVAHIAPFVHHALPTVLVRILLHLSLSTAMSSSSPKAKRPASPFKSQLASHVKRPRTTASVDDVLKQLASDALHLLSSQKQAGPQSPQSANRLAVDTPQSPVTFFKRAGIHSTAMSSPSRMARRARRFATTTSTPPPPSLPRLLDFDSHSIIFSSPPVPPRPVRRRSNPDAIHLTPSTARAAQSLLDLNNR